MGDCGSGMANCVCVYRKVIVPLRVNCAEWNRRLLYVCELIARNGIDEIRKRYLAR